MRRAKAAARDARQRVLMICMGNICRSPMAEAVLRHKLQALGLDKHVEVDSAGTHASHSGERPDPRAVQVAATRGYDLSGQRARPVRDLDFEAFDLILCMDWDNMARLEARCPPAHRHKLGRLMQHARREASDEVPDPYYGHVDGFARVLDLIEDACDGLAETLAHNSRRKVEGTSGANVDQNSQLPLNSTNLLGK